jgi:hypothetical protein
MNTDFLRLWVFTTCLALYFQINTILRFFKYSDTNRKFASIIQTRAFSSHPKLFSHKQGHFTSRKLILTHYHLIFITNSSFIKYLNNVLLSLKEIFSFWAGATSNCASTSYI